jgi:N-dimethylarginine dimethylaminohydrolase
VRGLAAIVGGEVRVFELPYWRGDAELVHLLSVISPVAEDLAVVYRRLLPAGLHELVADLGIRTVEVPDEEYPTLGCNVLAIRPGS